MKKTVGFFAALKLVSVLAAPVVLSTNGNTVPFQPSMPSMPALPVAALKRMPQAVKLKISNPPKAVDPKFFVMDSRKNIRSALTSKNVAEPVLHQTIFNTTRR